ncbi:MAG: hypothetical protein JW727_04480 [Candidatus Aenigmarchaeota archaeon]|nr:hypothetical protein [Candidatus Aenigmarchaeota archaeon]
MRRGLHESLSGSDALTPDSITANIGETVNATYSSTGASSSMTTDTAYSSGLASTATSGAGSPIEGADYLSSDSLLMNFYVHATKGNLSEASKLYEHATKTQTAEEALRTLNDAGQIPDASWLDLPEAGSELGQAVIKDAGAISYAGELSSTQSSYLGLIRDNTPGSSGYNPALTTPSLADVSSPVATEPAVGSTSDQGIVQQAIEKAQDLLTTDSGSVDPMAIAAVLGAGAVGIGAWKLKGRVSSSGKAVQGAYSRI